jgi:methyl-accepting chemotaxis protein
LRLAIEDQRAIAGTLESAREGLKSSIDLFGSTLNNARNSLIEIEKGAQRLADTQQLLLSAAGTIQQTQEKASSTSENLSQQLARLGDLQKSHTDALGQFRETFNTVDEGLGKILATLQENIEMYSRMVSDYTGDHLNKFDDVFATAANQLKSSSDMVREGLEQISDPLEELAKKLQR